MPKHPVANTIKTGHVRYKVNKTASVMIEHPGLEIINPALYQYSYPKQKPKGTFHCSIELQWNSDILLPDSDILYCLWSLYYIAKQEMLKFQSNKNYFKFY